MSHQKTLEELIQSLPDDCRGEVQDFVEFLLNKHMRGSAAPLRQDWAGALKAHRNEYSSVALQHQAAQWRVK